MTRTRFDIERELLGAALDAPAGQVADWADRLWLRFAAPRRVMQPSLARLLDELATAPVEAQLGEEVIEPEFTFESNTAWWAQYWDLAEDILDGVTTPVLLSQLLETIPDVVVSHNASGK